MFEYNQPTQYDSTGAQEDINIYLSLSTTDFLQILLIFIIIYVIITIIKIAVYKIKED